MFLFLSNSIFSYDYKLKEGKDYLRWKGNKARVVRFSFHILSHKKSRHKKVN